MIHHWILSFIDVFISITMIASQFLSLVFDSKHLNRF
jgi:hypothetical protein